MKFVTEFKEDRAKGGKRMDWAGCLRKGKHLLKYKNTNSLRVRNHQYLNEKD